MVFGSFASGGLLTSYGWGMVCWVTFPPILVAAMALFASRSHPAPAL